ncbi:MAG: hypothetical protein DRH90_04295 [Deltaproteobacteria bacterium]|nr:MAG: hypothetical protein DRH90_04295 [Deltaproteobacteria bacterium]RLC10243.1 MAG: hypothetical protein DRI24_20540 [Deltaproteobacteria bacterium]
MENMAVFTIIKRPVIPEVPIKIIATPIGTDILFLTKIQNKANPTELKLPFSNHKSFDSFKHEWYTFCQYF